MSPSLEIFSIIPNVIFGTYKMLTLLGDRTGFEGTYVLHIHTDADSAIQFGRFRGGTPLHVPAGEYAYVGSALGKKGYPLASRLLRHATRTPPHRPHPARQALYRALHRAGLCPDDYRLPQQKRLHWHIDYLLDDPTAKLRHVYAIRSETRLEAKVADWLAQQTMVGTIAGGLGAGDAPGNTHLFRVKASLAWWDQLPDRFPII